MVQSTYERANHNHRRSLRRDKPTRGRLPSHVPVVCSEGLSPKVRLPEIARARQYRALWRSRSVQEITGAQGLALTEFQRTVANLIAENRRRSGESYVAGGAALNSIIGAPRLSDDVDI